MRPHPTASRLLLGLLLAAPAAPASADSWLPPRESDHSSPDGTWRLHVVPGTCPERPRFGEAHAGTHASGTLQRPDGGARTFPLAAFPTKPCAVILLDSGDVIAADQYYQRGYGTVLARYDAEGGEVWRASLAQLLPPAALGLPTTSVSSRHWLSRGDWLREVREEDDGRRTLVILLAWHDRLEVDLGTGAATWVQVPDHGGDAVAWRARGKAIHRGLITPEVRTEARTCFERAIATDPHLVPAWYDLASTWRDEDLERALAILGECLRVNPLPAAADAETGGKVARGDPRLRVQVERARLLSRAGRHVDALSIADDALQRLPGLWGAQRERMRALTALGRTEAVLALADEVHAGLLLTFDGEPPGNQKRHHAALEVSGALREDGHLLAALQHLERARGLEGFFWDYVERDVGELLEELGRTVEAIAVVRGLLAHHEAAWERDRGGRFDDLRKRSVERTRDWLSRLEDSSP